MTIKKKSFESLRSVKSKEDSRQKSKKKMELKKAPLVIKSFISQKNTSNYYYFIICFTVFRADTMEQLSWLLSKGMYTILARILWELCWAATTTGKMIHNCS